MPETHSTEPLDRVPRKRAGASRDARKLAELYGAGLLTVVRSATPAEEAVRDLCRAHDPGQDRQRCRPRRAMMALAPATVQRMPARRMTGCIQASGQPQADESGFRGFRGCAACAATGLAGARPACVSATELTGLGRSATIGLACASAVSRSRSGVRTALRGRSGPPPWDSVFGRRRPTERRSARVPLPVPERYGRGQRRYGVRRVASGCG